MLKKRNIISFFITLSILFIASNFWLEYVPIGKNKNYKFRQNSIIAAFSRHTGHLKSTKSKTKKTYHLKFHFEIFVIILVLSYLLAYKLVDYLADFKTIKGKSRIEILFLAVFFTLLFIPMANIDKKSKISKVENRKLAKWSALITKEGKINYNFGKDYDNWYNDRFLFREQIVKLYHTLRYLIAVNYFENTTLYMNKKTKWLNEKEIIEPWEVTQEGKDLVVYNINKLLDFCNKNSIKPYIIIAPKKGEICKKELYPLINPKDKYVQNSEIIDYVKEKTGLEIIYPFKELENMQKNDMAYFKTDHHWTDGGAYLGYLKLMNMIKKDCPDIRISGESDFNYKYSNQVRVSPKKGYFEGITYNRLNLHDEKLLDTEYKYFYSKNPIIHKNTYAKEYHLDEYFQDINAPDAVLYGDSFSLNLQPILPTSFRNTVGVYKAYSDSDSILIEQFENYITKNNPKFLILCFYDIMRLQHLYKEKK